MESYSNNEARTPLCIDRKSPEITRLLSSAQLYQKHVQVTARKVLLGEKIETILADGILETTRIGSENEWLVTNPTGEQFILSDAVFTARNQPTDTQGVFAAVGYIRAIPNPYASQIEIHASWGSPQYGDQDCFIVDICDQNGVCSGEPYLIGGDEFLATYQKVVNT
jgi:hypothetical protein